MYGDTYDPTDAQRERDRQARQEKARFQRQGGRAVSARNATTHGLFARDIALPSLGEDPGAFDALLEQFTAQIKPANLLERHYTEQIAAASWRLRRLHRWQAQLFEDPELTEDQRLDKLDRVQRHEISLSRQIDRAVKMLVRELPQLFEGRTRRAVLNELETTEAECEEAVDLAIEVENLVKERLSGMAAPPDLDLSRLDTAGTDAQNCQNEPSSEADDEKCQNELMADIQGAPPALHPDGRPVYMRKDIWQGYNDFLQRGDHAKAHECIEFARTCYDNAIKYCGGFHD